MRPAVMRLGVVLTLLSLASGALARPFAMDLPPGDHYLKISVPADGEQVRAVPFPLVKPEDRPQLPPITPEPPPIPDSPLQVEVRKLTLAALGIGGSPDTAAKLAQAYALVSDECSNDKIPPELVFGTQAKPGLIPQFTDSFLTSAPDREVWAAWRIGVSGEMTKLRNAGKLTTKEQISQATLETAVAMRAALSQRGVLDQIPWDEIKKFVVPLLTELLFKLLLDAFKTK